MQKKLLKDCNVLKVISVKNALFFMYSGTWNYFMYTWTVDTATSPQSLNQLPVGFLIHQPHSEYCLNPPKFGSLIY